jgi:putative flippase GtrA
MALLGSIGGHAQSSDATTRRIARQILVKAPGLDNDGIARSTASQQASPTTFARVLKRYGQILRFLVVGGLNTAVGFGSFATFNYLLTGSVPYPYMVAGVLSNVVSITVAFIGYKFFVFRSKGNILHEYLRTFVVYGSLGALGLVLLPILVFLLGRIMSNAVLVPYVAQAVAMLVVICSSFFGHKKYSFRA